MGIETTKGSQRTEVDGSEVGMRRGVEREKTTVTLKRQLGKSVGGLSGL